ncbi:MAG: hypothetical protein ACTSPY_14415 [Candidatus Helarchaeota archaeon]
MIFIYFLRKSFESLTNQDISHIDYELNELCKIIRSIFFISNDIRKENTLNIITNNSIIEFNGAQLKNLRPDQVNIIKYLKKINERIKKNSKELFDNSIINILPGVRVIKNIPNNFLLDFSKIKKFGLYKKGNLKYIRRKWNQDVVIFLNYIKILDEIPFNITPADISPFEMDIADRILIFNYLIVDNE